MAFYKNIFCFFYFIFIKLGDAAPKFAAVILVVVNQMLLLVLPYALFRRLTGYIAPNAPGSKIVVLAVLTVWVFLIGKYFLDEARFIRITDNYKNKSKREKIVWGIVSWSTMVIPPFFYNAIMGV